jgi:biopolymer transport protein ExbD
MSGKRGNRGEAPQIELNLVPIMALLVVLIPILLYAFKFFEIRVQAVSAPRMSSGKAKKKKETDKKPLNLTVLVSHDRFTVSVHEEHDMALRARYPDWDATILKKNFKVGGKHQADKRGPTGEVVTKERTSGRYGPEARQVTAYDYPALYTRLMQVKQAYPKETTVNIGAKMDVRWQIIARTIDTSRLKLQLPAYSDMEQFSMAVSKQQSMKCSKDDQCNTGHKCNGGVCQTSKGKDVKEAVPLFQGVVFVVAEN